MLLMQLSHIQFKERHIKSLSGYQEIYRGIQGDSYIVSITIAVKKGFSNLRITSYFPIDASYDIQES